MSCRPFQIECVFVKMRCETSRVLLLLFIQVFVCFSLDCPQNSDIIHLEGLQCNRSCAATDRLKTSNISGESSLMVSNTIKKKTYLITSRMSALDGTGEYFEGWMKMCDICTHGWGSFGGFEVRISTIDPFFFFSNFDIDPL